MSAKSQHSRTESVPSKKPTATDLPQSLGRQEVIDTLVQELNQLELAELAYWWEQMIGSNYYVEGDRLVKCDPA